MVTIVMMMNCNIPSHAVFRETFVLGESFMHDKTIHELIGYTKENKVYRTYEYWDEDKDEVVENKILEKECNSNEEAIDFAKELFGVTKVVN